MFEVDSAARRPIGMFAKEKFSAFFLPNAIMYSLIFTAVFLFGFTFKRVYINIVETEKIKRQTVLAFM
jgi:hypothetical protein